jgi:hypothetical protein
MILHMYYRVIIVSVIYTNDKMNSISVQSLNGAAKKALPTLTDLVAL